VRAFLAARWRGSDLRADLDVAVQEVFFECFSQGGPLEAAGAGRVPSFRAFLHGVIRNVARRCESRPVRAAGPPPEIATNDEDLSRMFERTWAQAIMAEAAQLQRRHAGDGSPEAIQRVELLRLRFQEKLPIRAIAEQWGVPAAGLHHDQPLL
jgi:RNA polymerase sigma-70 factor (ECF subfamily)